MNHTLLLATTVVGAFGAAPCFVSLDVAPDGGNDTIDVNDPLKVITTWGGCP